MEIFFDVFKNSILIAGLVIVMMIMIEYINVQSKGKWLSKLNGNPSLQVLVASLLGMIPGCIGGFAAVSLYTHRLISFGALVAMMICSSGDEAFVMLAMIPETALILFLVLFLIAVISGILVNKFHKVKALPSHSCNLSFDVHKEDVMSSVFKLASYKGLKFISKQKLFILFFIGLFSAGIISGTLECSHCQGVATIDSVENIDCQSGTNNHIHTHSLNEVCTADHSHSDIGINILNERWLSLLFAFLGILTFILTLVAKEHFVKDHLWNHIIKKHLLSIFLWTFGALLILQYGIAYFNFETLIKENLWIILLVAVLIGIIPESGPHMVFISLFAGGVIPFSILLANSIVQDGHTALPLLAENKKDFIIAKMINMLIGFSVGGCLLLFGF